MATICDLTAGRLEPCKSAVGGIKSLTFLNYQEYDVTVTAGVITAMLENDGLTEPTGYRYIVRGTTNNMTQTINSSRDTGTTYLEQVVSATLKVMTATDNVELMLLIYGRPVVIVEDNNGLLWTAGIEYGCDVTAGTSVTGGAMGELNGYTLTLTGMEKTFAPQLEQTVYDGFTIVEGV